MPSALYTTVYNLFVAILSLLSHNEFLYSILGMLRWLFRFTLFFLARTTASPPTGSDDFIVLLYFQIVFW